MKALIIHGIGGHAGIHWQGWLSGQLTAQGFEVRMPNLPDSAHPDRKTWLWEIKRSLEAVDLKDLIIVAHSLGVTSALDFFEQATDPIRGLVSVAGFASDYGAELNSYFLSEKKINFAKVLNNLNRAEVIYGDDDPYVSQASLRQLASDLRVKPTIIHNGGHLNTESGYSQIPELLEIIRKI